MRVIGLIMGLLTLLGVGFYAANGRVDHPEFQLKLPFSQTPYALWAQDLDDNGRPDLILVSHGQNQAAVWRQTGPREFEQETLSTEVGFHPGYLLGWPQRKDLLLGAEGEGEIRRLALDEQGMLRRVASIPEAQAVELLRFEWPEWGPSLLVRPFLQDQLVLLRDFNPETLQFAQRQVLPLASQRPSLMIPGRLTRLDADQDGVEEIYYGIGVARQVRRLVYPGPGKALDHSNMVARFNSGHPQEIHTADFNGDGFPDLLVPDSLPNGWLHILMNDGHGQFTETPLDNLLPRQELQGFALKREQDGNNLLLVNATRHVHLLKFPAGWSGEAGKVEVLSVPKPAPEASVIAELTDLDQDGWLDAIISLDRDKDSVWLCYGPLWDHFAELQRRNFKLN